jgi:uncharacterized protein (DUF2267 family)
MSSGFSEFDATVQKTNIWLKELGELMQSANRHQTYYSLRTVLHALRDHLPIDAAVSLGAQLPMLVRGFYYEGWHPAGKPLKQRNRDEFLKQITERFADESIDSEEVVRCVITLLNRHLSQREVSDLKHRLPADLRTLWPPYDVPSARSAIMKGRP